MKLEPCIILKVVLNVSKSKPQHSLAFYPGSRKIFETLEQKRKTGNPLNKASKKIQVCEVTIEKLPLVFGL